MYSKNTDVMKKTDIFDTKKMYLVITEITENLCKFEFRNFAEFFYFVMFPLRSGFGDFYINNICKSTVN